MRQAIENFCAALHSERELILCTHVSPDADAIGSTAALQLALQASGRQAVFHLPEPYAGPLTPYLSEVLFEVDEKRLSATAPVLVVDTATKERTYVSEDFLERFEARRVYVLDHHGSNPAWGTVNAIVPYAPASASLVLEVLECMNLPLSVDGANLLFAGLTDDTGSFRFSNAGESAFLTAAKLVHAGAQPSEIANALYFSIPERVMRLRAMALETLALHERGRIASIVVTAEMFQGCQATAEDSDGIIDIARSMEGVLAAVFLRQREDGWRVSLRSKNEAINVDSVAAVFGGGGHRAAAGCTLNGMQLEDARAAVVGELAKQLS